MAPCPLRWRGVRAVYNMEDKMPKKKPATNITEEHKQWLDYIQHSRPADMTVCLFSCFLNGEPTAAVCMVNRVGGEVEIRPMFVAVTPGMKLVDHDGTDSKPLERIE